MKKETLLIAIFVALIILWITETLGMKKHHACSAAQLMWHFLF